MSTFSHPMSQPLRAKRSATVNVDAPQSAMPAVGNLDLFAREQLRSLVRQVYLTSSEPSRQVVFSAVDQHTNISGLCLQVAETLSREASGATCLIDGNLHSHQPVLTTEDREYRIGSDRQRFGRLRDSSLQISSKLWTMPAEVFVGEQQGELSAAWLRSRLAELRLEFDHVVVQAPAVGSSNAAALLARHCDGMVLVLEANYTRRVSARRVKEKLGAAHVRLLGTILSERSFPIPPAIYKRV